MQGHAAMKDSQHARLRDKNYVTPMLRQHETAWVANKRPAVDAQRGQAQGLQDTRNFQDIHGFQSNNTALRYHYFAY